VGLRPPPGTLTCSRAAPTIAVPARRQPLDVAASVTQPRDRRRPRWRGSSHPQEVPTWIPPSRRAVARGGDGVGAAVAVAAGVRGIECVRPQTVRAAPSRSGGGRGSRRVPRASTNDPPAPVAATRAAACPCASVEGRPWAREGDIVSRHTTTAPRLSDRWSAAPYRRRPPMDSCPSALYAALQEKNPGYPGFSAPESRDTRESGPNRPPEPDLPGIPRH